MARGAAGTPDLIRLALRSLPPHVWCLSADRQTCGMLRFSLLSYSSTGHKKQGSNLDVLFLFVFLAAFILIEPRFYFAGQKCRTKEHRRRKHWLTCCAIQSTGSKLKVILFAEKLKICYSRGHRSRLQGDPRRSCFAWRGYGAFSYLWRRVHLAQLYYYFFLSHADFLRITPLLFSHQLA